MSDIGLTLVKIYGKVRILDLAIDKTPELIILDILYA